MKTNHRQLVINKRKSLGYTLIKMAKKMQVSMPALLNFEQGLPVSDSSERKIETYIEGVI